jgi:CubicO group peptidase (beta-lactamase class C family)
VQIAKFLGALLASCFVSEASLMAQTRGMSEAQIDTLAERAMQVFSIPGMSVGVIKDGKIVHAKGYGVRAVGESGGIDTHTLYPIASMSKTFTAGALAVLVDEGKLRWDDKVIDHLPEFRLADAWETREVSIRDILSHRLGLSPGAGGLMFYTSADFSRAELVHNLQYFRQTSPFRAKFVYDNLAFVVAGEVVARIAGESYEDFVDEHVLEPAGMSECTANTSRLAGVDNIARPHAEVDGKVAQIRKLVPVTQAASYAAAGGLYCNLDGMLRYVQMHLARRYRSRVSSRSARWTRTSARRDRQAS